MSEVTASMSKGDTRSWESPIEEIVLAGGELLIHDGDKTSILKTDKTYKPKTAAVTVYAIDHSNFAVVSDA